MVVPDHPRSRGVYRAMLDVITSTMGSSPLARGLPSVRRRRKRGIWIIPARAGFTRVMELRPALAGWIIPARAGFTRASPSSPPTRRDHPRSRGVYGYRVEDLTGKGGSSPLARGLRDSRQRPPPQRRIIPARAGFTRSCPGSSIRRGDHPRSRGVYDHGDQPSSSPAGSSPLARGLRLGVDPQAFLAGIIPARAGFTHVRHPYHRDQQDHPRSRGVYMAPAGRSHYWRGSSPLARGLLADAQWIGQPEWDHPRSRGVYRRA